MLPKSIQKYIDVGEADKLHERYKCRIRKPWYKVPSIYSTQIGMLKRCHEAPRLVLNKIGAYTTDTAYRITSTFTDTENLVCSFLNPITAITAELEGRYYGGGVLELVPSEIEKIYIPIIDGCKHDMVMLNDLVRSGKITDAIRIQGEKILTSLGFSKEENEQLIEIWQKLQSKRMRK